MEQKHAEFTAEKRAENDNRKVQTSETVTYMTSAKQEQETYGQRWNAMQFSKAAIVWICLAMIAGTMIVGFSWGGWVTGGTAQKAATTMANDAVVQRLSSICVAQFQQDPTKDEKLIELKAVRSYEQRKYIEEQGWSIMPGEEGSDTKVATACAKVLTQLDE